MDIPLRSDGRRFGDMRTVKIEPGFAPHAAGSVLVSFGNTRVICGATYERRLPPWMLRQGVEGGWCTAEYSMLPYSTLDRKQRDSSRGKVDGRTVEIQRLIGRSLRAVIDLKKLPGHTLWVDCDVLQADGGTRTAAITGAWVAAELAVRDMLSKGAIKENAFREAVAAISVGIVNGTAMLDLAYEEDKGAEVDANVVMTASGNFGELQCTGEAGVFSESQMKELSDLAKKGINELLEIQRLALGASL